MSWSVEATSPSATGMLRGPLVTRKSLFLLFFLCKDGTMTAWIWRLLKPMVKPVVSLPGLPTQSHSQAFLLWSQITNFQSCYRCDHEAHEGSDWKTCQTGCLWVVYSFLHAAVMTRVHITPTYKTHTGNPKFIRPNSAFFSRLFYYFGWGGSSVLLLQGTERKIVEFSGTEKLLCTTWASLSSNNYCCYLI